MGLHTQKGLELEKLGIEAEGRDVERLQPLPRGVPWTRTWKIRVTKISTQFQACNCLHIALLVGRASWYWFEYCKYRKCSLALVNQLVCKMYVFLIILQHFAIVLPTKKP